MTASSSRPGATGAPPGCRSLAGRHRLDDFGPALIAEFRAGRTVAFEDAFAGPLTPGEGAAAAYRGASTRAAITVPLVKAGRFAAALYVHGREPRRWTAEDQALVREAAERTWAAVERARAEAALRESEARFRLMADTVPQIVWITDAQGRVEFFNRQWSDYTGVPYEPTTATEVAASFVHPDDASPTMERFDEARRSGGTFLMEHRVRSKDGDYRWFLVRADPYRDQATGEVVRWFGTSVDIHDRKLAEAALRELNERLETRVAERTAELMAAEDTLRQSQKMEAVGQLTGGIAHDFNNMLQGIAGALDLMQRRIGQGRAEEAGHYGDAARKTVERAAALTHRLLAFARRQTLQPRSVEPDTLIEGMAELIRRTVGPAIMVELRPGDGIWCVLCDPSQLENALLNLAVNARDAMAQPSSGGSGRRAA